MSCNGHLKIFNYSVKEDFFIRRRVTVDLKKKIKYFLCSNLGIFYTSVSMFIIYEKNLRKFREVNSTLCVYNMYNFLPGIMSDFFLKIFCKIKYCIFNFFL